MLVLLRLPARSRKKAFGWLCARRRRMSTTSWLEASLLMTAEVGEADADVAQARREYVRGDSIRAALRDAPKDVDGLLARRQCLLAAAEAKEAIAKVAQAPSEISEDGDPLIAQREGTDAWSEEDAVDRMLGPLPAARILFSSRQ
jgi:hypothetical protein